jgi:hypothetical protein
LLDDCTRQLEGWLIIYVIMQFVRVMIHLLRFCSAGQAEEQQDLNNENLNELETNLNSSLKNEITLFNPVLIGCLVIGNMIYYQQNPSQEY